MTETPYATAAHHYRQRGWNPLPLPPRRKLPPPVGFTGYAGADVSGADIQEWIDQGRFGKHQVGNVALRTPDTVLGLDVDGYGDKAGLDTFLSAIDKLGPLPETVMSTSRDDKVSGIRLYRVPPGRRWADELGPGVEVIHHGHRYVVAAPSIHPEGMTYRWLNHDRSRRLHGPPVEDLPDLPQAWVDYLDRGDVANRPAKALGITDEELAAWLAENATGEPCRYVVRLTDELQETFAQGGSRHDAARATVAKLIRAADQGHRGVQVGLDTTEDLLRRQLDAKDGGRKRGLSDPGEFERMVAGAVAIVQADPCSPLDMGCCGLEAPPLVELAAPAQAPAAVEPTLEPVETLQDAQEAARDAAHRFAVDVERESYVLRVREAAKDKVAAEKAVTMAPFEAGTLAEMLALPPEPAHRVEGLIPAESSTLLAAQKKSGKTTLTLNLARSLIQGSDFLGRFPVRPVEGRVAILNYEVSRAMLSRWADEVGVPADRFYTVHLRGRRNPLRHREDRQALAELLRAQDVEALIVDPFSNAYGGKSQNDAAEVSAFLLDLGVFARAEVGAADLILTAHAGWDGERTRGSSALEDWPDVILTMTRDRDDSDARYLSAEGRDVTLDEDRLEFDRETRTLTLAGAGSRKKAKASKRTSQLAAVVVELVTEQPGIKTGELEDLVRARGVGFQRGDVGKAGRAATDAGLLTQQHGPRNSVLWFPKGMPPSAPKTSHREHGSSPESSLYGRTTLNNRDHSPDSDKPGALDTPLALAEAVGQ